MDRKEKRKIRKEIIAVLDANCRGCERVKVSKSKDPYCSKVCSTGKRLQSLASLLIVEDEDVKKKTKSVERVPQPKRKSWTKEEEFYLLNHCNYFSVAHIATKLERSVSSVYVKLNHLKKLTTDSVS